MDVKTSADSNDEGSPNVPLAAPAIEPMPVTPMLDYEPPVKPRTMNWLAILVYLLFLGWLTVLSITLFVSAAFSAARGAWRGPDMLSHVAIPVFLALVLGAGPCVVIRFAWLQYRRNS